jgi:hypothetical protein
MKAGFFDLKSSFLLIDTKSGIVSHSNADVHNLRFCYHTSLCYGCCKDINEDIKGA